MAVLLLILQAETRKLTRSESSVEMAE